MMKKIMRFKKFLIDVFFNTFSFGIYIVSQQLIFLPIMGKLLNTDEFARLVTYISVSAILTNVLGSELGITRQVMEDNNNGKEYSKILLLLFIPNICISVFALIILKYTALDIIILTIAVLFANIRLYSASYFRLNKKFKMVLIQNCLYVIGMIIGILIYSKIQLIWIPIFLSEILPLILNLFKVDFLKKQNDSNMQQVKKTFKNLSFVSLLVNGMAYFDRIIVYPILGEVAMSVYYATTAMSKVINLLMNPLDGVLLSWIKSGDNNSKNRLIKMALKMNIPILLIVFIVSTPLTYLALKLLYSQYLQQATILIIPVCLAISFSTVSSLEKAMILKFVESKKLVTIYVLYFIIFLLLVIPMSKYLGLLGFAYSNVIAKMVLCLEFWILLKKVMNEKGKRI